MKSRTGAGLSIVDVEFNGNTSGWTATDYNVIVMKDEVKETYGDSGIFISDASRDQEEWVVTTGIVVEMGDAAFTRGASLNKWENAPQVGDRVMLASYRGQKFIGDDDRRYFMVTDKDIIGRKA